MEPTFFATPSEFRTWLEENHGKAKELWVGFYKKGSGKPSITYPESVDEALCFGWIDGVRKSIDAESYVNRFSPRTPRSTWSNVNVKRAEELIRLGRMRPAGRRAFEGRAEARSGIYSYEQRKSAQLGPAFEKRLRANRKAWTFFRTQPDGYRSTAIWWVMTATKEETRKRRLAKLIEHSERGRRVPPLTRPTRPT